MKRAAVWLAVLLMIAGSAQAQTFTGYQTKASGRRTLSEGVTYTAYRLTPLEEAAGRSQRLFVIDVQSDADVRLTTALKEDKVNESRMRVSEFASQENKRGLNVLAAINGDFFDMTSGGPLGYMMRDGRWLTAGEFPQGWSMGFTADGRAVIGQCAMRLTLSAVRNGESVLAETKISALNAYRADVTEGKSSPANALTARRDNALVLYTKDWGTSTFAQDGGVEVRARLVPDITTGMCVTGEVTAVHDAMTDTKKGTKKVPQGMALDEQSVVLSGVGEGAQALAALQTGDLVTLSCTADALFEHCVTVAGGGRPDGGPLLVKDGAFYESTEQSADDAAYFYGRNPRTVFGIRADGSYFFLVIEGNRSGSYGMTIDQTRQAALDLGADIALNLDGGPSSALVIRQGKKFKLKTNTTGTGRETLVGNALLLTKK